MFVNFLIGQEKPISDWKTTIENENLLISERVLSIDDKKNGIEKEYIQYSYQNKTQKQLYVNWDFKSNYKYSNEKLELTDEDYRVLILEPNQTFIPKYSIQKDRIFLVFKRVVNAKKINPLIYSSFANLTTKKL